MQIVDRSLRSGRDDGVSTVIVALSLVALIAVAALAIDGGQAYANRRQTQNGADAGAMAGTRAVDRLRFGGVTDGGTIYDAVDQARAQNGGSAVSCWLIGANQVRLTGDVCTTRTTMASAWTTASSGSTKVAGVEVKQTGTKQALLAKVVNVNTLSASASAAATIQPYLGGGSAPFIICGDKTVPPGDGYDLLNADGSFKSDAFTKYASVTLQGGGQSQNGGVPGCGLGASFDGKLDQDVTTVFVGQPAKAQQGNGFNSQIRDAVVQAGLTPCPPSGPFNGCGMLLPIANASNGGNGNSMMITPATWGVFKVYGDGTGNPKYWGQLLAAGSVVDGGIGGSGDVGSGQARLIKLVK